MNFRERTGTRREVDAAPEWQVLVVGDDVSGLATAGLLRRFGLDPIVVGDGAPRSGGVLLPNSSLDVLAELGIATGIRERATPVIAAVCEAPDGRTVDEFVGESPYAVDRTDLHDALARALPDEFYSEGTAVRAVDVRRDVVEVTFDGGVVERFDALVGCDGRDSTVRTAVVGSSAEHDVTRTWSLSVGADRRSPTVTDRWNDECRLSLLPAESGVFVRVTGVDGTPSLDTIRDVTTRDEVAATVHSAVDSETGVRGVSSRLSPVWSLGRVAFVGEAAWPTHPSVGVGVAAALADARDVVAALVGETGSVERRLARYGERRRRETAADASGEPLRSIGHAPSMCRLYESRRQWASGGRSDDRNVASGGSR